MDHAEEGQPCGAYFLPSAEQLRIKVKQRWDVYSVTSMFGEIFPHSLPLECAPSQGGGVRSTLLQQANVQVPGSALQYAGYHYY